MHRSRLFGEHALEMGAVGPVELQAGLELQESLRLSGIGTPRIGAMLVSLGYMSHDQVAAVREAMARS